MRPRLGILPARVEVVGLRPGGPLGDVGLRAGDRLIAVDDRRLVRGGDLELALLDLERPAELIVDRPLAGEEEAFERLALPLPEIARADLFRIERHLALGLDMQGLLLAVQPDEGGHRGGLRDGDRLLAIDGEPMEEWSEVFEAVREATARDRALALTVERRALADGAEPEVLELTARAIPQPEPEVGSRFNEYGFAPRTWDYDFRADGPLDAIRVGLATSWLYVEQTWLTLKGMLLAKVSTRNIGGPVAIGQISYSFAESGWPKLLYFLCMLSVNLALINLLPIPVLDGGHLLFLLVEKVKGSPVSERVVGYSQLVGVVFIVGLMVYVTFNDIRRVLGL
jgi:regulator of sigma E protease